MTPQSHTNHDNDYRNALARLFWLRGIAFISQFMVIALSIWGLQLNIHLPPLLIIIFILGAINLFVYWRLKQPWVVNRLEIAINLTIDVLALAALLYFSGGSTNPLVSLFIIPVALTAVFLPVAYIIWMVLLTVVLYSVLMEWYIPLPAIGPRFGGDFNLHIMGMYGNFIFSAILIAIFVFTLARTGRKHERELAHARERILRNQHVVETGLLAANAAHEINTPLSTIGLLTEELIVANDSDSQTRKDAEEIQKQVEYCKKQLQVLQHKASLTNDTDDSESNDLSLEARIIDTVDNWSSLHPEITVTLEVQINQPVKLVSGLNSLMLNMINLMDNAADASIKSGQTEIKVTANYTDQNLIIDIDDFGDGLSEQQLSQLGKKPYTSKSKGMGIGLLLSHATLDHLGGNILLSNHRESTNQSGIRARMTLPLESTS